MLMSRSLILALLPIGPVLHSISSNFCSCTFTWSCSTRTELVQKWSLLVRIRTSMERISICFFEPGDLRFRPDSGQMEEDLDALQLALLSQIIYAQEELQQARGQSEEDLINWKLAKTIFHKQFDYFSKYGFCLKSIMLSTNFIYTSFDEFNFGYFSRHLSITPECFSSSKNSGTLSIEKKLWYSIYLYLW